VKELVECPYCDAVNTLTDFTGQEYLILDCHNCGEQLWEIIPKRLLVYESLHFVLNFLVYVVIIFLSAKLFESYPEWREASGFILTFSLLLASISLHEFFHSFSAFVLGDYSVYREGYLRLNFLKYFSGIRSMFLPGVLFLFTGFFEPGAVVYIQLENIRRSIYRSFVFLAGVFSQVIFFFSIMYVINSQSLGYSQTWFSNDLLALLHFAAGIQILILLVNLLPMPGNDGWNAIFYLVSKPRGSNLPQVFAKLMPWVFPAVLLLIVAIALLNDAFAEGVYFKISSLMGWVGIDETLFWEGLRYGQLFSF
tara:strand:- start:4016 stop:4942 length:927 start_codon:yes stop_codon:yes gene_type:complete